MMSDLAAIRSVQVAAWGTDGAAEEATYATRLEVFPEGVLVAEEAGRVVGVFSCLIIGGYDLAKPIATWAEATAGGLLRGMHDMNGETVYGIDLATIPESAGAGTALMVANFENVVALDKRRVIAGAQLGEYAKHAHRLSLDTYLRTRVVDGEERADAPWTATTLMGRDGWEYLDGELDWMTSRYFLGHTHSVHAPLPDYFPADSRSHGHAALLCWENPQYGGVML
ncbi:hypothetical protein KBD18_01380 [Patescibacteria group bacterium]|nr:hypothetical protein [Patescibacteria group bacterium]